MGKAPLARVLMRFETRPLNYVEAVTLKTNCVKGFHTSFC